jgi:hypothetical protein
MLESFGALNIVLEGVSGAKCVVTGIGSIFWSAGVVLSGCAKIVAVTESRHTRFVLYD